MGEDGREERRGALGSCALLVLVLACADAGRDTDPCRSLHWERAQPGTSLVLVVNDTMRRDAAGVYGGRARTPVLDALAGDAVLFERAYAAAPHTKPSVASLFTSLYPSQHRVGSHPIREHKGSLPTRRRVRETDVMSAELTTLAEVLRDAGFRTAAFVSNPWMESSFGFAQGFEVYEDVFMRWNVSGTVLSERAARWLETLGPDEKYFLYVHYIDTHRPYPPLSRADLDAHDELLRSDARPVPPRASRLIRQWGRLEDGQSILEAGYPESLALLELVYEKGVEHFDRALGTLLEAVAARPQHARTGIVVTSDHGESLFAHGFGGHATSLYEDEVAIPLVMKLPGLSAPGGRSACRTSLVDLMPTLLDYLGLEGPGVLAGVSLVRQDAKRPGYVVVEGVSDAPQSRGLVGRRYKLVWEPDPKRQRTTGGRDYALFDLQADEAEQVDLLSAPDRSPQVDTVFQEMSAALADAVAPFTAPPVDLAPIEAERAARLRLLGYLEP